MSLSGQLGLTLFCLYLGPQGWLSPNIMSSDQCQIFLSSEQCSMAKKEVLAVILVSLCSGILALHSENTPVGLRTMCDAQNQAFSLLNFLSSLIHFQ